MCRLSLINTTKHLIICIFLLAFIANGNTNFKEGNLKNLAKKNYPNNTLHNIDKWVILMERNKTLNDWHKLHAVNNFFNRMPWASDWDNWQRNDYWANPMEMLIQYSGDCEDYAIAKYFTLIKMGLEKNKLRLTYSIYLDKQIGHMVLIYYSSPQAEPLILDNIKRKILPASNRPDLHPVYSFKTGRKLERALASLNKL